MACPRYGIRAEPVCLQCHAVQAHLHTVARWTCSLSSSTLDPYGCAKLLNGPHMQTVATAVSFKQHAPQALMWACYALLTVSASRVGPFGTPLIWCLHARPLASIGTCACISADCEDSSHGHNLRKKIVRIFEWTPSGSVLLYLNMLRSFASGRRCLE